MRTEELTDTLPQELRSLERWLCWEARPSADGNMRKVPVRADGKGNASTTDPTTWSTYEAAVQRWRAGHTSGVGIALGRGLLGIDLDGVRDADTGDMLPWALELVRRMGEAGAYVEVSPSGTGVHALLWLEHEPDWAHNRKHEHGGSIECYWSGRYFTVTGEALHAPQRVGTLHPEGELARALDALMVRQRQQAQAPARAMAPARTDGCTPYGARAMQAECDAMRCAPQGTRNPQLNRSAYALAQLAAGGEVDAAVAQSELAAAARAAGLGEEEIRGTLRSGWDAGWQQPRSAPEPQHVRLSAPVVEPKPAPERVTHDVVRERIARAQELNRVKQGWKHQGIMLPQYPAVTDALDGIMGYCLMTGGTGVGKTTWTLAAALSVAMRARLGTGEHAGVADPEDAERNATTQPAEGEPRSPDADVVYLSTEMTWTEQYNAMVCMLAGVWVRDYATKRKQLVEAKRRALDNAERTLHGLLTTGRLHLLCADDVRWHGWKRHALEGLEEAVHEHVGSSRVLVVVDTLSTMPVQPRTPGGREMDDFERDGLVVEGCERLSDALEMQLGALLAVAEEAKHMEGSGDMHGARGSSKYAYRTSQRLALVSASREPRSRWAGLRIEPRGVNVSEVDMLVGKGRGGGHGGSVVPMLHAYTQSRVVELERYELRGEQGTHHSRSYWTASELENAMRHPEAKKARKDREAAER